MYVSFKDIAALVVICVFVYAFMLWAGIVIEVSK